MSQAALQGLMMDYPLTLQALLKRAKQVFPEKEIVSRLEDLSLHRTTYGAFYGRVLRLMEVLRQLGVKPGDRVGTFAWNSYRHLELHFAIPCMGAVLHTLNVRLTEKQLTYIVQHAGDRWIFADRCLVDSLAPMAPKLAEIDSLQGLVVMDDGHAGAQQGLEGALDYETLMDAAEEREHFPKLDENQAAGLCYTSGTTGDPKGVLYSHRSYYLHSMGGGMLDSMAVGQAECVLPVVPMFHANAWGFPFTSTMTGAKLVLPGMHMTGALLADLIERERVTLAAGVPTLWNLMLQSVRKTPRDLSSLRNMIVGGSAVPRTLIQAYYDELGITITQAWGMTETMPVGSCTRLKTSTLALPLEAQLDARKKQGVVVPGMEVRLIDDEGCDLPWDGKSIGELCVRGPWVARSYFEDDSLADAFIQDEDGLSWFRTSDVVTIDEQGYIEIVDRTKDLIKSRGEWISSVELENTAMSHDDVLEAAVTGRPDEVRGEVPVLWFVVHPGADGTPPPEQLLDFLGHHFEHWQLPKLADIHAIDAIPKTSVGKFDKKVLRARR